jgi:acetyl-CoA carboxylase biotin carboxylase subunit
MRVVVRPEDLPGAIRAARSEASTSFGDAAVYLERRIERPRHIEVQVLADQHGTVVPFVERECSIQRRHQKVIEESPSAVVSPALRARLAGAARAVAASVGYVNAGTIEFLVDADERFYFLEMNTRLQVEHPVTELVTGVDLVAWQIRIARGEPLTIAPASALTPRGHAIECRVYAEDPDAGFLPSPGTIAAIRVPDGPGIRDDSGVGPGSAITVYYDSLLSKLASWGEDRPQAIARMARALDEYDVLGVKTSLPFLRWMLAEPAFAAAAFHTEYLDGLLQQRGGGAFGTWQVSQEEVAAIAAAVHEAMCREAAGASRPAAPGTAVPLGSGGGGGSAWKRAGRLEGLRP